MRGVSRIIFYIIAWVFLVSSGAFATDSCPGKGGAGNKGGAKQETATIEGTITSIEADGTLVVRDQASDHRVVYVRNTSKVSREGKGISRRDLKIGDTIRARVDPMRKALEVQLLRHGS